MADRALNEAGKACSRNAVGLLTFFLGFHTDNIALVTKVTLDGMELTTNALLNIQVSLTSVIVRYLERVESVTVAAIFPEVIGREVLGHEVLILLVLAMDWRPRRGFKSNSMVWTVDSNITVSRHWVNEVRVTVVLLITSRNVG